MSEIVAEAIGVGKTFFVADGPFVQRSVVAVDSFSLALAKGESVGLVGESGSGKSTVGRLLLGLIPATQGTVRILGKDIAALGTGEMRALRRDIQIVFQNPHTALHPRMTVAQSLAEPLHIQRGFSAREIRQRIGDMVERIALPKMFLDRYPHELSGGQKQRICIARALMLKPKVLILDEPTSALDVSVQAQILEFLEQLRGDFDLSYLFISHNLAVVQSMCTRILVMYRGKVVEQGSTEQVLTAPAHAYTSRLLAATLVPSPNAELPVLGNG